MKKLISIFMAVIMIVEIVPTVSVSAEVEGMGYGSNGKFIAPIEPPVVGSIPISNRAELEAIKNNLSGTYHLTANIDLAGNEWIPIGDENSPFTGNFDGQGYVISNLTITEEGYMYYGLFGYGLAVNYSYEGMIKNVGMSNINISVGRNGDIYVGGIVGRSNRIITNCYSTGNIAVTNSKYAYVGGIVGRFNGSITNCYNIGNITATNSENTYVGGIGGYDFSATNCYNTGNMTVSSSNTSFVGGIGGYTGSIVKCYNSGNIIVSSEYAFAGGISGSSIFSFTDCYNNGDITSSSSERSFAGGICGMSSDISINNCYNIGNVKSYSKEDNAFASGIIVAHYGGGYASWQIENCYWLSSSTVIGEGNAEIDMLQQLSTAQMKQKSSLVGFDFDTVWDIDPSVNNGYPFLRAIPPSGDGDSPCVTCVGVCGFVCINPLCNKIVTNCGVCATCTADSSLETYLKNNNPERLFGGYNFSGIYVDDVDVLTVFGYGITNSGDIFWNSLKGSIKGLRSGTPFDVFGNIANEHMNEQRKVDAILKGVVDELCNKKDFKYFGGREKSVFKKVFKTLEEKSGAEEIGEFVDFLDNVFTGSETVIKWSTNYSNNITLLYSLRAVAPTNSLLEKSVDELIIEYEKPILKSIKDWSLKNYDEKIQNSVLEGLFGDSFGLITTALEKTLGQTPSLQALDTVMCISTLKFESNQAFQNAVNKIKTGNYTDIDIENYRTAFDVCKALWIKEYEAMASHYMSGSFEERHLNEEIKSLENMTYNKFIHAKPFVRISKPEYSFFGILCPVDVDILDNGGTVVAKFVNNEPVYFNGNEKEMFLFTIDDEKFVIAKADKKYRINLTATGNGNMDYFVQRFDVSLDNIATIKSFQNVSLTQSKTMTSEIKSNTDISKTRLLVTDGENPTHEILTDGTEIEYSDVCLICGGTLVTKVEHCIDLTIPTPLYSGNPARVITFDIDGSKLTDLTYADEIKIEFSLNVSSARRLWVWSDLTGDIDNWDNMTVAKRNAMTDIIRSVRVVSGSTSATIELPLSMLFDGENYATKLYVAGSTDFNENECAEAVRPPANNNATSSVWRTDITTSITLAELHYEATIGTCVCKIHITIVDGVIEISNTSDKAISCKGLYLTDDENELFKWQMPSVIIRANGVVRLGDLKRTQINFEIKGDVMLVNANDEILSIATLE